MNIDITRLFCIVDDFYILYEKNIQQSLISKVGGRRKSFSLSPSEIMTVIIYFQQSGVFRSFKHFYTRYFQHQYGNAFKLPSYNRFVELMPTVFAPLCVMLHLLFTKSSKTDIYFVDSTPLAVCDRKRIKRHRVFEGVAELGKTTKGWFFGLKLHLIINEKGEPMAMQISPGNTNDRKPLPTMAKDLHGKVFADKGYIGKNLFAQLMEKGIKLVTGVRNKMKNKLMSVPDKIMLRKRSIIETVFGYLKEQMGLEHTRHRSTTNAIVHIMTVMIAYALKPTKPSIKYYLKPAK